MNPYFETDKKVSFLAEASLAFLALDNAPVSPSMYQKVINTILTLPARLQTLRLSGQLDNHEVVILEQALLLLQVELSLMPHQPLTDEVSQAEISLKTVMD